MTTGTFSILRLHRDHLGSDFDYDDYLLDVRRYVPVGAGQVLAFQARGRIMTGEPPFYRLPTIGGIGMMRGLFDGRFRDKTAAAVQAEYRFPIWKIVGGVVFAGRGGGRASELSWGPSVHRRLRSPSIPRSASIFASISAFPSSAPSRSS
jgi:hypothetical protein